MRAATLSILWVVGLVGPGAAQEPDARAVRRTPIVEVVERVRDSVVNISATGIVRMQHRDPFLDFFFMPEMRQQVSSVGSGFVMHEAGYIVTNAHVVDRSIDLRVSFADGSENDATVVVSDPVHDLAILRIEPDRPLKPIPLGRSDDLMPGETAIAIGNPLGEHHTVTAGIVSALHRRIEASADAVYEDLIQTDAAINPGNSGGPLLNIRGELIGINTAIRAGAENIGYAIPVDQLRALVPDMLDFAVAEGRRIQLGVRVEGSERPRVVEVAAGSAAEKAGVRVGDELVQVDQKPIARDIDFYINMLGRKVGDRVRLDLRRGDQPRQVNLELAEVPKPDAAGLALQKFGLVVENLTPRAAQLFGARTDAGVLIMEVQAQGPARQAGCERGDLLVRIGRHRISGVDELGQLLEGMPSGTPAYFTLWRMIRGEVYEISQVPVYSR